jgi:uncharacterized repeat protein (TIGR01451 family)
VTNSGPDIAQGVVVTDVIPTGLLNVTTQPGSPTCTISAGTISCAVGNLAVGASAQIQVSGTTDSTLGDTAVITNTATVTSLTPDPDLTDNTDTVQTDIDRRSDLGITKTGPSLAEPGDTVGFTVSITNAGPSTATNVTWTDAPTNLGTCLTTPASTTVAAIAPGGSATWTVSCGPVAPTLNGSNGAVIAGASLAANNDPVEGDELPDSSSASLLVAAFTFDKSVNPDIFTAANQPLLYGFAIDNTGGAPLTGLTITDPKISGPYTCSVGGAPFELATDTLQPAAQLRCTATYLTTAADLRDGQVVNTAAVDTTQTTTPVSDTVVALGILPAGTPTVDLAVVKTVVSTTVTNQPVTWEIVVSNAGPGTDSGVKVTDTLPSGIAFVSAAGTNWTCTATGLTVSCSYSGDVPPGVNLAKITVVGRVVVTSGTLTNTASVTGTLTDVNLANNQSSVSSTVSFSPPLLPAPRLPATGADLSKMLPLGAAVMLLGLVLMMAAGRRRPAQV